MDIRQSNKYAAYMSSENWTVEKTDNTYCYIKKLPILGNFIIIQRPPKITAKLIKSLESKYHPFQIILEPAVHTKIKNFKQTKPYLPSKTMVLDLNRSEKKLYANLKKDCRYALRKNRNLEINTSPHLKEFRQIWKSSVPFNRHVPSINNLQSLQKSFNNDALFLVTVDKSSGAIFLKTPTTTYYWQAFTSQFGRKKLHQYRLVWEGILWAKKAKCKQFDFEGIYDNRFPNTKWLGFTHFKKSFGGNQVIYPEALKKTNWRNFIK